VATADEQIRVSDRVKRQLDRRRREGESYNDVLGEDKEGDFYDGFGRWLDEQAERIRDRREDPFLDGHDALTVAVSREVGAPVVSADCDLTYEETKEIVDVEEY
jgi:hypothetical protein